MVFGESEEEIHIAFLEAVRTGLVLRLEGSYTFLHDRIQEAAYALIPESARAEVHLRIGRELLASMTADGVAEHLFDVANQLNRGAALLIDHDEKVHVAAIDLRAGRKAKASAAYASAREYFATGMALLDESAWSSQYELTFSLWLGRAECEFLTGHFDEAEQLIGELLQRAAAKVDQADRLPTEGPAAYDEGRLLASRRQRAHVPERVWHRHARASDPGGSSGRIRGVPPKPQWPLDREL